MLIFVKCLEACLRHGKCACYFYYHYVLLAGPPAPCLHKRHASLLLLLFFVIYMTCESLPISLASSEQLRHQASLLPEDKRTIYSGFHADRLWRTRSFLSNSHPFLSTYGRPEYPPLARDHGTCFGQRGVSKHDLHRDWRGWAMPWSFYCQHEMNRFWAAHWLGQT